MKSPLPIRSLLFPPRLAPRFAFAFVLALFPARAADPMDAFPAADEGMTRHVLRLPARNDENSAKVEIIVGKTVMTDGVNRHFFGGRLESRTVEGWGYSYHILPALGPMAGTRMAPPPGAPEKETFVTLGGEPQLVRYNSRMPLVVYVPDGCEVRYRLWTAPPESEAESVPEG